MSNTTALLSRQRLRKARNGRSFKLDQSQVQRLAQAIRKPVIWDLYRIPVALDYFVTTIDQDLATILLRVGYIQVGVRRANHGATNIEYVWLTTKGREAFERTCLV